MEQYRQHKTGKIPIKSKVQIVDKSPLILTGKEFEDAIVNDDVNIFHKYDLNVIANLFTHLNIQLDKLIETNKPNIVKYALNNKLLDPNLQYGEENVDDDLHKYTALMLTIYVENNEIAKILLMNPKIDVNLVPNGNQPALVLAISRKNYEIAKMLIEHPKIDVNLGENVGITPLIDAILEGKYKSYEIAMMLLDHPKINVNSLDHSGETALMNTLHSVHPMDHYDIIKLLLERPDIDVNLQNKDFGRTALMIAINGNKYEIVKLLISHPNTDVNLEDKEGYTPLMKAVNCSYDIAKLLLKHPKIDTTKINEWNHTALDYATNTNNSAMIALFGG